MNAVSGSTTETEAFGLLSPARTLRPPPHVIVDIRELIADIPDWFVEAYESDAFGGDILSDNEEATATGDRLGSSSSKSSRSLGLARSQSSVRRFWKDQMGVRPQVILRELQSDLVE
ncbi:hypothetical protein JG688_00007502, partial [Phytophthora aleatoria]